MMVGYPGVPRKARLIGQDGSTVKVIPKGIKSEISQEGVDKGWWVVFDTVSKGVCGDGYGAKEH